MADGSSCGGNNTKQCDVPSFSVSNSENVDSKKLNKKALIPSNENLPCDTPCEQNKCELCVKSEDSSGGGGVLVMTPEFITDNTTDSRKKEEGDDRKKRCFDRYDSSESTDSGVAVLSGTESGCSGSDIESPCSPSSPEPSPGGCRMPPWATEPAPPAPRIAVQPAPVRRPTHSLHRRITEYFNQNKMKPQTTLKREAAPISNDDPKRRCLPKNGVTHDLEKYISYLSQTLSPKVLRDVGKHVEMVNKQTDPTSSVVNSTTNDLIKTRPAANGLNHFSRSLDTESKNHKTMNGFMEVRPNTTIMNKEKAISSSVNGFNDFMKQNNIVRPEIDSTTNGKISSSNNVNRKIPIPAALNNARIASATPVSKSPKKCAIPRPDSTKANGVVSSTTKLDANMNGVTYGSNNLSLQPLMPKTPVAKKEQIKKTTHPAKRTNRKSSACIANSKNLTWSKANNLKQVELQKQNFTSLNQKTPTNNVADTKSHTKINISNGVRPVPMAMNNNIPVTNFQNCHQLNIPQSCNGTANSTNLTSFVAVPQNVMLTALRIPQNGISAQGMNQQNNMTNLNRQNVNVSSPTKLNSQFVFPLMQNVNGAVMQIPNLMTKMPNFVIPQSSQMTGQRQDHIQNQQAAQFLINGTLLKLTNTISPSFSSVNKPVTPTSQPHTIMNKNFSGIPNVGMTMQAKQNYNVAHLSHPVLMPQPGFIVTSVPNINVKETWSYTGTSTVASSQTTCSNPIAQHQPPIIANFAQALNTSSIPISPVKPPDNNPIQGTDPPSSTVKEPDTIDETSTKSDIPWLSKTVNNNIVPMETNKLFKSFVEVSSSPNKSIDEPNEKNTETVSEDKMDMSSLEKTEELRKVEEVARREETIFTQITVLKDVSSNVQNALLEANYPNRDTPESSESGIGTSIDSPSDSNASKECDEDSSQSLSVSIFSGDLPSSQKSPMLKQPQTLRFPPIKPVKESDRRKLSTETTSTVMCRWENCEQQLESDSHLIEHLQVAHVETQAGKEHFVCLWQNCKVRGKPSCSRLWLERHTQSHGGNKPFKCIVDGCARRFSTQTLLQRHVNNHFNEASPNTSGSKKTNDSASKLIRRNGKKLRYRRQPWSARMFDYFDAGIMEGLAYRIQRSTKWRMGGACPLRDTPSNIHTITVHATLTATRYNAAEGRKEALLTYYPPNVLEDEWVPEKDVKRIKKVEISKLPVQSKVLLFEQFCASYRQAPSPPPSAKSGLKPQQKTTPVLKTQQKTTQQKTNPKRTLPARHCASSRLLNNLLTNKRKEEIVCNASYVPMVLKEEEKVEVSGAKKRKMGRRYGGNSFWPCGR